MMAAPNPETGSTGRFASGKLILRHFLPLLAPALTLVVVFAVVVLAFLVPLLEQNHLEQKFDLCRRMVESAMSNLESDRAEGMVAGRPLFEVQYRASERLRDLRFGGEGKDYYWIIGPDGRFLMHPYRPDLEGRDPEEVIGPDGEVLAGLIGKMQRAVEPGADGMLEYRWHWKDDLGRLVDKVSYVDRFESWGWIVGTGVYTDDVKAEVGVLRRRLILAEVIMAILGGGVALILSVRSVRLQRSEAAAHAQLAASEENLRITLQSIGDGVIATDTEGCVREMNAVAENLTGWSFAAARGRPLCEVFCVFDDQTEGLIPSPVDRVLVTGDVVTLSDRTLLVTRQGTRRRIADSGAPIRDRGGRIVGVVMVFRDVTEEHALQEQLRQVQKMEVIGQLAGGVAHDFNNMLAAIMGNAELLDLDLDQDSTLRPQVSMIINGTRRAADLTQKLLAFSRKGQLRATRLDVHQPIREAIALLQRSLDRNIRIETRFESAVGEIVGDPTLLQNAFLNLAVNARDAMPGGGILIFSTVDVVITQGAPETADVEPGHYVEVSASDTGVGMPPDVLDKVFEPFYTTKPVGKGTGLGLATVYGTVQEHRGAVRVSSRQGQGTTVRILLPRGGRIVPTEEPATATEIVKGQGLVLVVDDETLVLGMAEAQLRSLGYDVITASDGAEALEAYTEHGDRIAVVLLDLVMPVMGGRETMVRLREMDPDVRVVLTSGFDPQGTASDLSGLGASGFLAKPYRQAGLSQAIDAARGSRAT